jgi:hypothetical protein
MEFTGLSARREFDEKMQLHLPVLGQRTATDKKQPDGDVPAAEEKKRTSAEHDEKSDELPGGLAEIIRDLTRRPSG